MIRRAPNGLVYASERRYGLPLVIDPDRAPPTVIGQTGASHGELADSFAIAFSSNAYGLLSEVTWAEQAGNTLTAGQEIGIEVLLRDSLGDPTSRLTSFDYVLTGSVEVGDAESESQILSDAGETQTARFNATLVATKASISGDDTSHKWAFKIQLSGLEMQIGDGSRFWVQAAKTSPTTTLLTENYISATAGESITTNILAYDEFGNQRKFGDQTQDENDEGKFKCFNKNPSSNPGEDPTCSIARSEFGIFDVTIDSEKADTFVYEITYEDEPISNSPLFLTFEPGEISGEESSATGVDSLFEPLNGDGFPARSIFISLRDEFSNLVPVPFNSTTTKLTPAEWSEQKKMLASVNVTLEELRYASRSAILFGSLRLVTVQTRRVECLVKYNATVNDKERYDELYAVCDSQARAQPPDYADFLETEKRATEDGLIEVLFRVKGPEYLWITTTVEVKDKDGNWNFAVIDNGDEVPIPLNEYEWRPTKVEKTSSYSDHEMLVLLSVSSFSVFYNVLFFFLVWWWRNENAIKFSQKRMLNLMLFGFLIINIVLFLQSFPFFYTWSE